MRDIFDLLLLLLHLILLISFPNILAANVSNNIPRSATFSSLSSFFIVLLIPLVGNPDSLSHLTIFIISSISSFRIINAVVPDPNICFWIASSVGDAAAVNPNGVKTLLADNVSKFFANGKPAAINGLRKFKNPPSWLVFFFCFLKT